MHALAIVLGAAPTPPVPVAPGAPVAPVAPVAALEGPRRTVDMPYATHVASLGYLT